MNKINVKMYALTFDIDWAPDYMIKKCLEMLKWKNVKATFFTTHETNLNKEILDQGHNLGIHPNFLNNSSHGNTTKKIIENCLNFAPNAWCIRTHSLYQSSPLLYEIFSKFPQLKLDVSLFMHKAKYIQKVECKYKKIKFERLMFNWEDDAEFVDCCYKENDQKFFGPITIFNFHPIHIFLNSTNGIEYSNLKKSLNNKILIDLEKNIAKQFCNKSFPGVSNFFESVINSNYINIGIEDIKNN